MSGERYILSLDQGTTSSRAIVFDAQGRQLALAQKELTQYYPRPGWVEHDAGEIWRDQLAAAGTALAQARIGAGQVAAIGITNQRETTVVWDAATGTPVAPAIVWQCRRTAGLCAELKQAGWQDEVAARTGLVLDPYFSGTKLKWLLDSTPGLRERARSGRVRFGTVDSWLLWNLSGGRLHVTDVSNASRTLLFNIHRLDWDDDILAELDIPRAMLPEVRPSSQVYGETATALFGTAIPLAGAAGDQQAALFGQACFASGMAKNTYGTGCFALLHTGDRPVRSRHGLLTTVAWGLDGKVEYALEGSVFIAGAAVQWLRDGLQIIADAAETAAIARSVPDTGGVMLVPAFVGLGAPYWDPAARGTIVGLTRGTGRAHLVRAALEAIAFQSRDVVGAMTADAGVPLASMRVDGGAARNAFLMQFQADILGVPVERPQVTETTALGAAYLAGLAVGVWQSRTEIARRWQLDQCFTPAMPAETREQLYARWQQAVERALGWDATITPDLR